MKNKNLYLLLLSCLLLFNSCEPEKKKIKVGFLFNDFNSPRWERESIFFKNRIAELGGVALIAVAGGDEIKQYNQAMDFIAQGVDVIVITASNANTAAIIVRDAHKKGIKVIAYDGLILNCDLDYLVGFDLEKVGELQASYVLNLNPAGNYVILNGDKIHSAAVEMNNGILKVLKSPIEAKKIDIIYSGWIENWSSINAQFYAERIFEFSVRKIDAVIAVNDGIAAGVAKVLKEKGLEGQITLTGQDGDIDACNRILNGKQTMTVYKSSRLIAYSSAELAFKVVQNEKIEGLKYLFNGRLDVPTLLLDPVSVDKSNLESTIAKDGIYTMEEILKYSESKE
ncbi:MAG: substrate-binding domain-containing protein [Bacteroidales bacterium]